MELNVNPPRHVASHEVYEISYSLRRQRPPRCQSWYMCNGVRSPIVTLSAKREIYSCKGTFHLAPMNCMKSSHCRYSSPGSHGHRRLGTRYRAHGGRSPKLHACTSSMPKVWQGDVALIAWQYLAAWPKAPVLKPTRHSVRFHAELQKGAEHLAVWPSLHCCRTDGRSSPPEP